MFRYQTPGRRPPHATSRTREHCDPRVSRNPKQARPVQIYAVLGFGDRRLSESLRFELNISLSCSQADLGPTPALECFFVFFFKVWDFFVKIRAQTERY